jgi:hypothetical protein
MIVKTSKSREYSFRLLKDRMVENDPTYPYVLFRLELKYALQRHAVNPKTEVNRVKYFVSINTLVLYGWGELTQGKTQRGKKYIQIGCKRFVGVNRTELIKWAESAKA